MQDKKCFSGVGHRVVKSVRAFGSVPAFRFATIMIATNFLVMIGAVAVQDALAFHDVMSSSYTTPWYDDAWWKQPYTHLRLTGKPSRQYWGRNVLGTPWLIKEVKVDGKVFWTVLQRADDK